MAFHKDAVVVVFGCGTVGSGLVKNLVKYDIKKVIFTSRSSARVDKVYASIAEHDRGKVLGKTVVCEKVDELEKLKEEVLAEFGVINHVVAAVGTWREYASKETILSVDLDILKKFYTEMVLPFAAIGKVYLPYLNQIQGSRFIMFTDHVEDDFPPEYIPYNILLPHLCAKHGVSAALRQAYHDKQCAVIDCRIGTHIHYEDEDVLSPDGVSSTEFGELLSLLMCMKPAHIVHIDNRADWMQLMKQYKETLKMA